MTHLPSDLTWEHLKTRCDWKATLRMRGQIHLAFAKTSTYQADNEVMDPENSFPIQFMKKVWNGNKLTRGNMVWGFKKFWEKLTSNLLSDLKGWWPRQKKKYTWQLQTVWKCSTGDTHSRCSGSPNERTWHRHGQLFL